MKVRFSREARLDRREAEAYYRNASANAGLAFRRDLDRALSYIRDYALGAPVRERDVRAKTLLHFPYAILYRVDDRGINVLAIADERRDAAFYASRLR